MNTRILIFGDSYTWGAWDSEGGYVDRLKRIANQRTIAKEGAEKIQIFNLGIGGETSRTILKRVADEIENHLSDKWQIKLMFTFGANDVRVKSGIAEIPIDEFRDNVQKIIDVTKKYTDDVIFFGSPPVFTPIVEFSNSVYSDDTIKEYDTAMKEVVEKNGVEYVNVREQIEKRGLDGLYAFDDIHLNDEGHKFMAEIIGNNEFFDSSEEEK